MIKRNNWWNYKSSSNKSCNRTCFWASPATPAVQSEVATAETTAPSTEANAEVPAAPVIDAPVAPAPVEEQASSEAPAVPAEAQSAQKPLQVKWQMAKEVWVNRSLLRLSLNQPLPVTPAQPEATQPEATTPVPLDQEQVNQM